MKILKNEWRKSDWDGAEVTDFVSKPVGGSTQDRVERKDGELNEAAVQV